MSAFIGPNATVDPHVQIPDSAQLGQRPTFNALNPEFPRKIHISNSRQVLVIGPIGSRVQGMLTVLYGQGPGKDEIYVYTGCYGGLLEDFEKAVVGRKPQGDPYRDQYEIALTMVRRLLPWRQVIAMPSNQEVFADDWGG